MKILLIILAITTNLLLFSQENYKNFVGLQFGGQALIGFSYDRNILTHNNFKLNIATGVVVNEYADDQDPNDRPIYGINIGVTALYDLRYLFFEISTYSSPYLYKSLTFINYYSWIGLRFNARKSAGGFASIGWTPSFYYSKIPPVHYNNIKIGIKLGVNF